MKHLIVGATCYGIAIWLAIAVVHFEPFSLTTFMLLLVGYDRMKEGAVILKEAGYNKLLNIPQPYRSAVNKVNKKSRY